VTSLGSLSMDEGERVARQEHSAAQMLHQLLLRIKG